MSGVFQNIKILTPPSPLPLASVSSPRTKGGGGGTLAGRWGVGGGGGVNILEDARHWIGLLQYNPSTIYTIHPHPFTQQASGQIFEDDVNGFPPI